MYVVPLLPVQLHVSLKDSPCACLLGGFALSVDGVFDLLANLARFADAVHPEVPYAIPIGQGTDFISTALAPLARIADGPWRANQRELEVGLVAAPGRPPSTNRT